ncbi:MAG: glycosyltransferase [Elusimicrobia bacterium]|nr:glycosyltransferase [Candidatus Obscuribacterium magneticum]
MLGSDRVVSASSEFTGLREKQYDVVILLDCIQRKSEPFSFLNHIHSLLKSDGVLLITTPSLDSLSARIMKQKWIKFRRENRYYYDTQTIQTLLFKTGFCSIDVSPEHKYVTPAYIKAQIQTSDIPVYLKFIARSSVGLAKWFGKKSMEHSLSGMSILCRAKHMREKPLLSIVLPVFNERKTFPILMKELLPKKIPGIDKEIIIVESNSTDGTREEVMQYDGKPEVRIVWQAQPRGKGYAVRTGFEHASGDFILIQDGDLEYDLNDYESLLQPLLKGRAAFVLGTRHAKGWKIRQFQEFFLADLLNIGHWVLVWLMNFLYRQSMTDPFTMYKVFRKDCLFGLNFECDRFNFDIELVCKLLRKGYIPLEVPINYTSRPFSQGKKVKLFRDPPTWIKAIFKYKWIRVYSPYPQRGKIFISEYEKAC